MNLIEAYIYLQDTFCPGVGEKGIAYTLVTDKDKEFAGHLVRNLEGANQAVPQALMDLAMQVHIFLLFTLIVIFVLLTNVNFFSLLFRVHGFENHALSKEKAKRLIVDKDWDFERDLALAQMIL